MTSLHLYPDTTYLEQLDGLIAIKRRQLAITTDKTIRREVSGTLAQLQYERREESFYQAAKLSYRHPHC